MDRRKFIYSLTGAVALTAVTSVFMKGRVAMADHSNITKVELSKDEWQKRLTAEQYRVLRKEGTEPAGSSPLNEEKREGIFACAGCDLDLFKSETKYKSGTGWPSFYDVIEGHVETKLDFVLLLPRTEYHCARCGGHQGHIFKDGPEPTGLRYCNNGVALKFKPKEA